MKARVKATGDIVNASYWNTSANGIKYYDIDNSGYTMTEDELDFDLSYTTIDYWTRLEHQYAGMAMQGILANSAFDDVSVADIAITSIKVATSLIKRLKEERK